MQERMVSLHIRSSAFPSMENAAHFMQGLGEAYDLWVRDRYMRQVQVSQQLMYINEKVSCVG